METDGPVLQLEPTQPQADFAKWMVWAKSKRRKGLASQVAEIAMLSRGEGKLKPAEYYNYQLYDDGQFSRSEKRAFLGVNGAQKIYNRIVSPYYNGLSHDKLLSDALISGAGLPCPRSFAHYHPVRQIRAARNLSSEAELSAYLRDGMTYPFFEKPVNGWQSRGVAHVERYDADQDAVVLHGGTAVPVERFAAEIAKLTHGALFQEVLETHPEISACCQGRISTLRTIMLVDGDGAEMFRAVWKIPANGNIADNFWRDGNLLGDIDVASGRVRRVVRGLGPDQEELERHPDTDAQLNGITLPLWETVCQLSREVALLFPELRVVASDIGLTDQGPVVVEVNPGGDMGLPQIASGKGVMDERLRKFIADVGRYNRLFAV